MIQFSIVPDTAGSSSSQPRASQNQGGILRQWDSGGAEVKLLPVTSGYQASYSVIAIFFELFFEASIQPKLSKTAQS